MPVNGIERYAQSIGRDTMAQTLGGAWTSCRIPPPSPPMKPRVRLSARTRRGAWELTYDLSQVAHYFGVSTSLVAHALANVRFLSAEERDRLTEPAGVERSERAHDAMWLSRGEREGAHDAFVLRLVAMATEARRRGTLAAERIEPIVELLELNEDDRNLLPGTEGSETAQGPAARSDTVSEVSNEETTKTTLGP